METVQELSDLLTLEQIEENIFRGENYKTPWKRVFGGQVLAQALHAAHQTVPGDRFVHSLHAYFILPGDIAVPIVYEVDRIRDGGSFTTRRIVAIQKGRPIFNLSASFQLEQAGLDHQITMPNVTLPNILMSDEEGHNPYQHRRPVEFRSVERIDQKTVHQAPPYRHVWLKVKGEMPDDKRLHQEVLAYATDYHLLATALLPHRKEIASQELFMASLDHAMWFHRDFRIDQWLLYAMDSPSASNSRGFSRGNIFTLEGDLVASVVQEGLMRPREK